MFRGLRGFTKPVLVWVSLGLSGCSARLDWSHFLNGNSGPSSITLVTPPSSPGSLAAPTIRVHGLVAGDTVEIFNDAVCSVGGSITSAVATGTTLDFALPAISEGPTATYHYIRTDALAVSTPCSVDSVSYVYDATPPGFVIGSPSVAQVGASNSVSYDITYTGQDVITLSASDITAIPTGGVTCSHAISGSGSVRTVTFSGCTGNGTISFNVAANTAADLAGNLAGGAGPSASVTVDTTPPSLAISAPSSSLAGSASTVTYTLTYSGQTSVSLTTPNVTLNTTGGASCSHSVSGAGSTWTVTLNSCTGNGTVGISVAAGTALDSAGNLADAAGPSTTFTVDTDPPTLAISAPSASSTNFAAAVTYTITYAGQTSSSLVSGNVSLNTTGTANCTQGVSGGGSTYTVTLSSCTGDGTVGISIAAGTASDAAGNLAAAAGPSTTFAVDNQAPSIGISGPSVSLANSSTNVTYTVTYSGETSVTLSIGHVSLDNTGGASCAIGVSGSGSTRTVTLSSCSGNGTVGISIASGTAADALGNLAAAAGPSTIFTVDNSAPTLGISSPSVSLANSAATVTYTLTYSGENAITAAAGDITLNTTGGATCAKGISGAGSTRTVTLSSCTGDGTVGISVAAGTASDTAGNLAAAAGPSTLFTVDNTAPSLVISAPSVTDANSSATVTYTLTYSGENAITAAAGDITLNTTGGATCAKGISGAGSTRTVTLSSCTGDGTVGISVAAGTASDTAGNLAAAAGPSTLFTVDNTAPSLVISSPSSSLVYSGTAVTYTLTFSGFSGTGVGIAEVTVNTTGGVSCTKGVSGSGASYTVTVSNCTGNGTAAITIAANTATDAAGNWNTATGPSTSFDVDNTPPAIVIDPPSTNLANASTTVTYAVTYSGFSSTNLLPGNVNLNTTGGASCSKSVSGSGASYSVMLSSCTGNGTVGISIAAGTATDGAGNTALVAGPSANFTVDTSPPLAPSNLTLQNPTLAVANDDTPEIRVHGVTINDTVELHTNSSCTQIRASGTATGSTIDLTSSTLASGAYNFYARAIDTAGNTGACSAVFVTFTHDPAALGIGTLVANSGATLTNNQTFNLAWTGVSGAYTDYCIKVNDSSMAGCTWTPGPVPSTFMVTAGDGNKTLYAWTKNAVPTYSPMATSNTVELDMTPPATPNAFAMSSPVVAISQDDTPLIRVYGVASGDIVSLYTDSTCSIPSLKGTQTAAGSNVDVQSAALSEGIYNFYAKSADAAGNTSACSFTVPASISYQYDVTPPTLASFTIGIAGPTNNISYPVTWGSPGGDYVEFCINENDTDPLNCLWWPTPLPTSKNVNSGVQGGKVLSAWLRDAAGNISTRRDSGSVVFDNVAPTFTWNALPTVNGGDTFVNLSWTASGTGSALEANSLIQFSSDGTTFGGGHFTSAAAGSVPYSGMTMPLGNFPNAKFRVSVNDAAGNNAVVELPTRVIHVAPQYPIAPHWNSYYKTATPTVACAGSETGRNACKHGGERRTILAGAAADCTNITATDALGAFDWACTMVGPHPYLISRLKAGKNLFEIIQTGPAGFMNNSVTVYQSATPIYTSVPTKWWANTFYDETPNTTAVKTLTVGADTNPIYVIGASAQTYGYNINGDGISLVVRPPAVLNLAAAAPLNVNWSTGETISNDIHAIVAAGGQKFISIEGMFSGAGIATHEAGILLAATKFSRIRGPSIANVGGSNYGGLEMVGASTGNDIANLRISFAYYGISVDNLVDHNTFRNINISNIAENALIFFSPIGNVFQNVVITNVNGEAMMVNNSDGTIMTQATIASTGGPATDLSTMNFWTNRNEVYHSILLAGNGDSAGTFGALGFYQDSGSTYSENNTYSQFAIGHVQAHIDELSRARSNKMTGVFSLGTQTSAFTCYATGTTGNRSIGASSCINQNQSNATWVSMPSPGSLPTAFYGAVSTNDTSNATDASGVASHSLGMDVAFFENFYRMWGFNGSPWATLADRKSCLGFSCRIFEWTLAATDVTMRNRSHDGINPNAAFTAGAACPGQLLGTGANVLFTDLENGNRAYLKNAVELVGVGFGPGNEDGLCESNETCLYTPNFGAYQGHGTADYCTYAGATISGVKMLGYSTNGR